MFDAEVSTKPVMSNLVIYKTLSLRFGRAFVVKRMLISAVPGI